MQAIAAQTWGHLTYRNTFRIGYPDKLIFSPRDDKTMFIAGSHANPGTWIKLHTADAAVMVSHDVGETWELATKGMPEPLTANLEAMCLYDAGSSFELFAGTTDGKVYCSDNGAESWRMIGSDLGPVSKVEHYRLLLPGAMSSRSAPGRRRRAPNSGGRRRPRSDTLMDGQEAQAATLDELQTWIGREHSFSGADDVTRSDIRRKLEVYCFDCPLHYDDAAAKAHGYRGLVAPVTMTPLWGMLPIGWRQARRLLQPGKREQPGGIRTDLPVVYSRGVNTATEWEYFEPLYPGDRLSGNWKLVEIKPRQTRLGDGIFLTVETSIFKQSGELVAKNRNTGFRYQEKASDAPKEKREKPRAGAHQRERHGDDRAGRLGPPVALWRCRGRRAGHALFDVAELSAHRDECCRRSHVVGHPS